MNKHVDLLKYDVVIVGCGLTGAVVARHFADAGKKVIILERRDHIGGNMYDYIDTNGVRVHKYGPHVFHTYDLELMKYMEKYSEWNDYYITCKVNMLGKFTPSPFNLQTIDDYYEPDKASALKEAIKEEYPNRDKATIVELLDSKNDIIREYAEFLFEHDYSLYTAKQWGISPSEIDPSVLKRVPILFSYKDGYFDDTYQKVPKEGYSSLFMNLLDSERITVKLGIDALKLLSVENNKIIYNGAELEKVLIYTGPIDELFNHKYGRLPYRSLKFEWDYSQPSDFQDAGLVAYPEVEGFTRITEYNLFPNQLKEEKYASLAYEYPIPYVESGEKVEPYYPVLTDESGEMYAKYRAEADDIYNLYCCGRLAEYKYYNMDQALKSALEKCEMFDGKLER